MRRLSKTLREELEQGYITVPLSEAEALRLLGADAAFARRFIFSQRDKLRPIDDYTVNKANACLSTEGKSRPLGRYSRQGP
eukprot:6485547-Amphidinium_carterae.1